MHGKTVDLVAFALSCLLMRHTGSIKSSRMLFCHISKTAPSPLSVQLPKTPSFELNSALLSRARVYLLKVLAAGDISQVLDQAMNDSKLGLGGQNIELPEETRRILSELVGGDVRRALNSLEIMADMAEIDTKWIKVLTTELLKEVLGERSASFDNKGDRYYDLISALHKSVRGSALEASLYSYAHIITAGGDQLYVARRLLAIAYEDIGNADPRGMQVAIAA